MAITNFSAARKAGFKAGNRAFGKAAAITMTKFGTRTLYISLPPEHWHLTGSSVAIAADGIFAGVTLPDANTGNMYITTRLPVEWSSGTNVMVDIYWKSAAVANEAKFSVSIGAKADSETTALSNTQAVTTTVNATANKLNKSTVTFADTLFAVSDWIGLHVSRDPADGDDDLAADLVVIGIVVRFTGVG